MLLQKLKSTMQFASSPSQDSFSTEKQPIKGKKSKNSTMKNQSSNQLPKYHREHAAWNASEINLDQYYSNSKEVLRTESLYYDETDEYIRESASTGASSQKEMLYWDADPSHPNIKAAQANSRCEKSRDSSLYRQLNVFANTESLLNSASAKLRDRRVKKEPKETSLGLISQDSAPYPLLGNISDQLEKMQKKLENKRVSNKTLKPIIEVDNSSLKHQLALAYQVKAHLRTETETEPKVVKKRCRGKFTPAEDEIIASQYERLGPNWNKIKTYLAGRSEAMIRKRFDSYIKPKYFSDDSASELQRSSELEEQLSGSVKKVKQSKETPVKTKVEVFSASPIRSVAQITNADVLDSGIKVLSNSNESTAMDFEDQLFNLFPAQPQKRVNQDLCSNIFDLDFHFAEEAPLNSNSHNDFNSALFSQPQYILGDEFESNEPGNERNVNEYSLNARKNSIQLQEDNYYNLLNFNEEDEGDKLQFDFFSPIGESPLLSSQKKEDQVQLEQFSLADKKIEVPASLPVKPAAAGLNTTQLEALFSQIKSLEKLFDRTRKEITNLHTRMGNNK